VIDYRLLGPLEVGADGHAVEIGGLKQRALLAILLIRANQSVPRDVLVDQLWGEHPPAGAQHSLEVYVSRLRKTLEPCAGCPTVLTRPGAYLLRIAEQQLDVNRFERLAEEGRRALAAQAPGRAAADLREALALWRGAPLADLSHEPFAQAEIARLEKLRLGATEDRIEADLALGHHADVISELEALVAAHPWRERLHQQLMIALYRCGRQAESLAVYQAARRALMRELGIEPSPALRRLEHAILEQDVSLEPASRAKEPQARAAAETSRFSRVGRTRLKQLAGAGTLAVVTLALLMVGFSRSSGGAATPAAGPDTVGVIDSARNVLSGVVTGAARPNGVAYGAGAVWITDSAADLLLQVDSRRQVVDRIPVGRGPAGVAVGDGEVWVANELDGTVSEVNPRAGREVARIQVGNGPDEIAFGFRSVWVANVTDNTLSRIDPGSDGVIATIPLGSAPAGLAVGDRALWVTSAETGRLLLVDPLGNRVSRAFPIGNSPGGVAFGAGSVWVADADGTVWRFDPLSGRLVKFRVGRPSAGVAYADGAVWVANTLSGSVSRINPGTGSIVHIHVGNEPTDLAAGGGGLWTTVLPSPASHRGGTLTMIAQLSPQDQSTDPAVANALPIWQMLSVTNDGLVGYRRVGGVAGDTLIPDLATTLASPANGGKTYTFQLRSGIKYSDGTPVKPTDFRRAIQRVFRITQGNIGPAAFYTGIVGAAACERAPHRCDLARGITTNDKANTVSFHLTTSDPEFLYKLALPFADAVPPGTPDREIVPTQLPATGPYLTQSYLPRRSWVLVRNPQFHEWSDQAQPGGYPDRIILGLGLAPGTAVDAVEHGHADVMLSPPPGRLHELATGYASQLHSGPLAATIALVMNTRVWPFSVLAARQAVNDAIDRNAIIELAGGPLIAQPTCQILPPTLPGYQPYCPYTTNPSPSGAWAAPDLARAKHLIRASGTRGAKVTVFTGAFGTTIPAQATGRYLISVLDQLGYRASLRVINDVATYDNRLYDSREHPQIGWFSWYQDYPVPSDFISPLLTCSSFLPGNPGNLNAAEFCNRRIDAQVKQALAVPPRLPNTAGRLWTNIDHELVDQAPWVPLYNPRALVALSARVGNYQFQPYWTLLIDQLWVR
jgi:YVTN family beta-propeller protein